MGYSYAQTASGRLTLVCDECGTSGGVRRRTCPHKVTGDSSRSSDGTRRALPYCPPPALCRACWVPRKRTVHAACRASARAMQAGYDAVQARLDAGELIAVSARSSVDRATCVVTFAGAAGAASRVTYLVPAAVYAARPGAFLAEYPDAVPERAGAAAALWDGLADLSPGAGTGTAGETTAAHHRPQGPAVTRVGDAVILPTGESRSIVRRDADGLFECPWCRYPVIRGGAGAQRCDNPTCWANGHFTAEQVREQQAQRAARQRVEEDRKRSHEQVMAGLNASREARVARWAQVSADAAARGACLVCLRKSRWEYGEPRYVVHRLPDFHSPDRVKVC